VSVIVIVLSSVGDLPGEALLVMVKILLGFVSLLLFSFSDGFDLEVHLGSLNACLVLESSLLCLL